MMRFRDVVSEAAIVASGTRRRYHPKGGYSIAYIARSEAQALIKKRRAQLKSQGREPHPPGILQAYEDIFVQMALSMIAQFNLSEDWLTQRELDLMRNPKQD